jgi:hypothetical protein
MNDPDTTVRVTSEDMKNLIKLAQQSGALKIIQTMRTLALEGLNHDSRMMLVDYIEKNLGDILHG